jgi:hypothetical protein
MSNQEPPNQFTQSTETEEELTSYARSKNSGTVNIDISVTGLVYFVASYVGTNVCSTDEYIIILRNAGTHVPVYAVSCPRRSQYERKFCWGRF